MRPFLFLLFPLIAGAALVPEAVGPYKRTATSQPVLSERPLWDEYGLKESESGNYENGKKKLTVSIWRLQDPTGALGAYQWQCPQKSRPSAAAKLAVETPTSLLVLHGNYLASFEGYKPSAKELGPVLESLPKVDTSSLPVLAGYLPSKDLIPNSNRYVIGPAALEKFTPAIPASVAAFRLGAEAQLGVFKGPRGEAAMAIFNYPTHQIAMDRVPEFEKIPGTAVRRSGPLVSVVLNSADPDFSEKLLSQVRFQAEVMRDEYVPTKRDNIGHLLINAFVLIGILLALCVCAGIMVGGLKAFRRRGRKGEDADALVTLDLSRPLR
jgi:uncharacterized protein DUF6599